MSFWVRESIVVVELKRIPRWLRTAITSGLVVFLFGGWGAIFYYPLIQRQQSLTQDFIVLKKQKELFEKKLNQGKDIQEHYNLLAQQLATLFCDNKQGPQSLLDMLMNKCKRYDLVCKHLHPEGNRTNALFDKKYVYFDVKGSFKNIKTFLRDVCSEGLPIKYKKIMLLRWKDNTVKCQALVRASYCRALKAKE